MSLALVRITKLFHKPTHELTLHLLPNVTRPLTGAIVMRQSMLCTSPATGFNAAAGWCVYMYSQL